VQRARAEDCKNTMACRRNNLRGAGRHRHSAAHLANNSFSVSRRGMLLQKLSADAQVAAEQQVVRRVHTQLHRRQRTNEENQNHRLNRALGYNRLLNGFHARPHLTRHADSANADSHGSSGNRCEHAYFEAANFQENAGLRKLAAQKAGFPTRNNWKFNTS
jgi:hypothetical protein